MTSADGAASHEVVGLDWSYILRADGDTAEFDLAIVNPVLLLRRTQSYTS